MNPQFKSFAKRDPYEILLYFINGLHEELNKARFRADEESITA